MGYRVYQKILASLVAVMLSLSVIPLIAYAADDSTFVFDSGVSDRAGEDVLGLYDPKDVAVINHIIETNWPEDTRPSLAPEDGSSVPADWSFATWSDSDSNKRVTGLNLANEGLMGTLNVSALTALEKLECGENNLVELNLSGLTSLTYLDCWANQLTSLDVSSLTGLKTLRCDNNKLLTELDVSHNTSLEWLDCYFNEALVSIDVSGCTALTTLNCGMYSSGGGFYKRGSLTELDVSGLTALTKLDCSGHQLTSLDISNQTGLTWLDVHDNLLTSLDLSNQPKLEILNCGKNQLSSLDLSNITVLRNLYCDENKLTSLDVTRFSLRDLVCNSNQLTSLDLSNQANLIALDCSDNYLTSLDVSACTKLEALDCRKNRMPDESAVIGFTGEWGDIYSSFQFNPQRDDAGDPDDSGSGGGSNSSDDDNDNNSSFHNSSFGLLRAPSASSPVTTAIATAAVDSALKKATYSPNEGIYQATATLRNPGDISFETIQAMAEQAGTTQLTVYADSIKDKSVDVRITFSPVLATKGLNLSGSTVNDAAKATTALFGKYFTNKIITVALEQQGDFGMLVEIAVKLNPEVEPTNLVFYSYNKATNTYIQVANPRYWVDKNNYVHFNTNLAGHIIISDGALLKR